MENHHALDNHRKLQNTYKKTGLGYLSNYRIFYKKLYKIFIKCLTGVQSAYNVHFEKLKITNKHIQTKLANLTLFFIFNILSVISET
ncbi:hypothetical protein BpHYR1_046035 [Brachionus plicatilis]|uniref:Uncharacterized protein n=1 Tax=Brachionus plicatilis TaxID=10195 RepID=A0A3M7Q6E0_BRAPC|nr:hypothetical protein BpHYR1_046035 [Brachionus plicatilis]